MSPRRGHEVTDHRSSRTVARRGPATLGHNRFLERISDLDREGISERVGHVRGPVADGGLEATAGEALIGTTRAPNPVT